MMNRLKRFEPNGSTNKKRNRDLGVWYNQFPRSKIIPSTSGIDIRTSIESERMVVLGSHPSNILWDHTKRNKVLETPLPNHITEKAQRIASYQEEKKEVSQWDQVVKKNRQAEQLDFPLKQPNYSMQTASSLTKAWKPETELEKRISELLNTSENNLTDQKVLTPAELKAIESMNLEESFSHQDGERATGGIRIGSAFLSTNLAPWKRNVLIELSKRIDKPAYNITFSYFNLFFVMDVLHIFVVYQRHEEPFSQHYSCTFDEKRRIINLWLPEYPASFKFNPKLKLLGPSSSTLEHIKSTFPLSHAYVYDTFANFHVSDSRVPVNLLMYAVHLLTYSDRDVVKAAQLRELAVAQNKYEQRN